MCGNSKKISRDKTSSLFPLKDTLEKRVSHHQKHHSQTPTLDNEAVLTLLLQTIETHAINHPVKNPEAPCGGDQYNSFLLSYVVQSTCS